jgi:hypothetical protein
MYMFSSLLYLNFNHSNNVVYRGEILASSYGFATTYCTIKCGQRTEGRNAFCCTQTRCDDYVFYTMAYCSCGLRYKPTQSAAIVPLFRTELLQPWNEADTTPHVDSVNMGSDISLPYLASLGLNY